MSPRSAPLLLAACLAALAACAPAPHRPNVVVVVIDTLRADRLPFYGYGKDTAPYLGEWARRGVVFDRAWSASSWTAPSTASLFTSVYPIQHGVTVGLKLYEDVKRRQDPSITLNRIPDELETLPVFLRDLGYRTFGITDNPNVVEREGFERGFDRFRNFDYAGGEQVNAVLERWLDEIRAAPRAFVYLHYMDPHWPYHERQPWFEPPAPGDEVARVHALYDSEIRYVDECIRQAFERLGVDEEWVVVLTSDHGEELLQRGSLQHDFKLYSELTHVPLIVNHPGAEPVRRRVGANVSLLDVLPTLREILGAPASDQDEGVSLVPYYLDEALPGERTIFSMRSRLEVRGGQRLRAVVHGQRKLILGEQEGDAAEYRELYDLDRDWAETRNLAAEDAGSADELATRWRRFEADARRWERDAREVRLDPDEVESLRGLGYVEDER